MGRKFVLTAELQLRGPANLNQVVSSINKQLSNINATVNLKINQRSAKSLLAVNKQMTNLNTLLTQVATNSAKASSALQQLSQVFQSNATAINNSSKALKNAGKSAQQTGQQFAQAKTLVEDFGAKSALALKRFAAFSLPAGALLAFTTAVKSGISSAIEFQNEMVRVSQVTGRSLGALKPLQEEISRLAIDLGVSSKGLSQVSVTLAQAGLSATNTRIALEALAKTEVAPTFDNITNTTEGAIAIMQQFDVSASGLESTLSSLNSVAAAFAVESSDIVAAVRRTGGAFKAAGGNFNELIALFTSVRQTTRESAETIATGFRTIFTRLQRPQTIKFLQEFGINLKDLEGKFVGPYEAVLRLSEGLSSLDSRDLKFAQITEELGGFRQISKVIPLIQQASVAQRALSIAQAGTNSLARDATVGQQSFARQIAKVREEFEALFRTITSSGSFQTLLDSILTGTSYLIKLTEAASAALPVLGAVFTVKGIKLASQFGRGFTSQFGGAQQAGANLGGAIGGANTAGTAQASAITSNTTALASLTTSIQRLTQIMAATGPGRGFASSRGFSSGRPRKFATGGLVPGQGNTDSVLTALMPGEFVIRKKAVESIGAENLQNINQLAGGRKADPNKEQFRKRQAEKAASREAAKQEKLKQRREIELGTGLADDTNFAGLFFNPAPRTDTPASHTRKYSSAEASIDSKNAIIKRAGLNPDKTNKEDVFFTVPFKKFYVGDEVKESFGNYTNSSLKLGIKKIVANYLGNSESISDGDLNSILETLPLESIKGSVFQGFIAAVTKDFTGIKNATQDFRPSQFPEGFSRLFGQDIIKFKYADAKLTDNQGGIDSVVGKALNQAAIDPSVPVKLKKFARGGSVPALVTPGEFIVNKSSAARIGTANLNKMNNSGQLPKFATGGQLTKQQLRDLIKQYGGAKQARAALASSFSAPQQYFNATAAPPQRQERDRFGLGRAALIGGVSAATPFVFGDIESAKTSSARSTARIGASISGATTGAVTGATLGAAVGPLGAAVGGVAGGLIGFVSTFKEQSDRMREIELVPKIEELAKTIGEINSNQLIPSLQTSQKIVEQIGAIRAEAGIKGQATFFESLKSSFGFDQSEAQAGRRRDFLAQNIPASELQRSLFEISNQFTNIDSFLGGQGGANTQLTKDTAEALGVSFNHLKGEIEQQIKLKEKERNTLKGVNDFYTALSKLSVVEDISNVFNELKFTTTDSIIAINNLAAAADGTISKFEAIDISELFKASTFTTPAAQQLATSRVGGALAPLGDVGKTLTDSVIDIFEVKAILPAIIDKISNTPILDIEGSELADVFSDELRGANISDALKSQLTDVFRATVGNSKDPEIQQDITKNRDAFIEKITAPFNGVTDAVSNIIKGQTDNINVLFESIYKVVENTLKIEEAVRGASEQRLDLQQFQSRKTVLRRGDAPFLTGAEITSPFNDSVRRLGGGLNSGQLSDAIVAGVNRKTELERQIQNDPNSAAREELITLTETLGKQRAALTLLTGSINEATKVQNELARVEAKIQASQKDVTNAFDKIVFGSAEDRRGLGRAFQVAQNAGNAQFLRGFSPKVLGETIQVLEQFPELFGEDVAKDVRTTLIKSLTLPEGVKQKLIEGINNGPAALRAKALQLEKDAIVLREQGIQAIDDEVAARKIFNDALKTTALDDFNSKAKTLAAAFATITQNILQNEATSARGNLDRVKGQAAAIEELNGILPKFKSPDDIRNFVNSASVQTLIKDKQEFDRIARFRDGTAFKQDSPLINNILRENTNTGDLDTNTITKLVSELSITDQGQLLNDKGKLLDIVTSAGRIFGVGGSGAVIDSINQQIRAAIAGKLVEQGKVFSDSRQRVIENSGGRLDKKGVTTLLDNTARVNELLNSIPENSHLPQLTQQIKDFEDQVRTANRALAANNPKAAVEKLPKEARQFIGFAGGGSVFQPRGTDTVPAMLTPGEFVINRKSTQANLPLIEKINEAKGPIYAADGRLITDRDRSRETTADVYRKLSFFQRLKADTVGLRGDEVAEILGQQKSNEVLAKNKFPTLSDTEFTRAKQREEALRSGVPTEALYEDEKPQTKAEIIARARKDVLAYETEQSRIRGLDKEFLRRIETKPKSQTSGDFLPTLVDITRTGIQSAAYDRTLPFRDQAFNEKDRLGRTLGSGIDYIRSAGGSNTDSYFGDMSDAGFAARTNQDSRLFDTSTTEARILNTRLNTQRDADRYRAAKAVVKRAEYEEREAKAQELARQPSLPNIPSRFDPNLEAQKIKNKEEERARVNARLAELDVQTKRKIKEERGLDEAFGSNDPVSVSVEDAKYAFARRDNANKAFENEQNAIATTPKPTGVFGNAPQAFPYRLPAEVKSLVPTSSSLSPEQQARIDEIKKEQAANARHEAAVKKSKENFRDLDALQAAARARISPAPDLEARKQVAIAEAKARRTELDAIRDDKQSAAMIRARKKFRDKKTAESDTDLQREARNRQRLADLQKIENDPEEGYATVARIIKQNQLGSIQTAKNNRSKLFVRDAVVEGVLGGDRDSNRRTERADRKIRQAAIFRATRNQPAPVLSSEEQFIIPTAKVRNASQQRAAERKARIKARGYATGGFVSGGVGFGDSVPAALSNGEYVLNRQATAKIGVPTLQRFNQGGQVQYKQYGGAADASYGGSVMAADSMTKFVQSVSTFSSSADNLASALNKIDGIKISMVGTHKVEVIHNGSEVFAQLTPLVEKMITEKTNSAIAASNKNLFTYSYTGPLNT